MLRWMLTLAAVAALAVPAAAAAKSGEINGEAVAVQGRGFLRAELSGGADAKPVHVRARAGFVRFVDLGGDMKVQCNGKGAERTRQNDEGQPVVLCAGRGRAFVSGSHFRIQGFALRYGLAIPAGYTGTVKGHVKPWDGREEPAADGEDDSAAATTSDPTVAPASTSASAGAAAVSAIDTALARTLAK